MKIRDNSVIFPGKMKEINLRLLKGKFEGFRKKGNLTNLLHNRGEKGKITVKITLSVIFECITFSVITLSF